MSPTISIECDPKNVFVNWHPKLIDLVMWVLDFTGEIVITSGKRNRMLYALDSGIHLTDPLRAIDIRSFIYPNVNGLCNIINSKFTYDPLRRDMKAAIFHNTGMGNHIHLQAHDRSVASGGNP